jgi:hypothetical protein
LGGHATNATIHGTLTTTNLIGAKATYSGTVTAGAFAGNGSGLTNLTGLTTGAITNGQSGVTFGSATVTNLAGSNAVFSGTLEADELETFNNVLAGSNVRAMGVLIGDGGVYATNFGFFGPAASIAGTVTAGTFAGNGASITNIQSTNIVGATSATNLLDSAGGVVAYGKTNTLFGTNATFSGTVTAGAFVGDGSAITNLFGSKFLNVKQFGATGNGVTDDTPFIQSAIDSLTNSGGTILFPDGIYRIHGAYRQVTGRPGYAQLVLPDRSIITEGYTLIGFRGVNPPSHSMGWTGPSPTNGAVLLSDVEPSQFPACVIGYPSPSTLPGWGFSAVHIYVQDLTIRTTTNALQSALDLSYAGMATVDNLLVDTGIPLLYITNQPTAHNAYGVSTPQLNNSAVASFKNINVIGYSTGLRLAEHCSAFNCRAWLCGTGFELAGAYQILNADHLMYFMCPTGIVSSGTVDVHAFINCLEFEHQRAGTAIDLPGGGTALVPTWPASKCDIYDPNNTLHGVLTYYGTDGSDGVSMTLNGAKYLRLVNLKDDANNNYGMVTIGGNVNEPGATPGVFNLITVFDGGATPSPYLVVRGNTHGTLFVNNAIGLQAQICELGVVSLTWGLGAPTNNTPPSDIATIKAWVNFTNTTGGVFKLPLYQ